VHYVLPDKMNATIRIQQI